MVTVEESGGSGNSYINKLYFKTARIKRLEVKGRTRDSLVALEDGNVGINSTMDLTRKDKLLDMMGKRANSLPTSVEDGDAGINSTMDLTKKDKPLDMMGKRANSLPTSVEDGGIGNNFTMDPTKLDKRKDMSNVDPATGNVGLKARKDKKVNVDIAVNGRNGVENVQSSFSFSNKEFV